MPDERQEQHGAYQRCLDCLHWQHRPGFAWWCGQCAVTAQNIGLRRTCNLGTRDTKEQGK